jgi:intracellular protein transport protein USO1
LNHISGQPFRYSSMEFLSQTYVALRGPQGAPQTATDTIGRLSDRLSPSTLLADRRAAVLTLKGLTRDHKQEIGERALPGLLETLYNDTEVDPEIGKAVLETLIILCEVDESVPYSKELGFHHTDAVLGNEKLVHSLLTLLGDSNFYTRLATLQFLTVLVQNRRQVVQGYFLTAQVGAASVISVLEDKREIIRNGAINLLIRWDSMLINNLVEAISLVHALVSNSPDIQKILAFEGAFEKLFNIVTQEGGIDGGIVAQEALSCVNVLLRFNTSNQVCDSLIRL